MSLKKRMFRSNMTILCSALIGLMLIIVAVLVLFEDSFEQQFHSVSRMALERHAAEAAQAVEQTEIGEMDKLSSLIEQWGYQAAVFSGGRVTAGESEGMMSDLAEYFAGDPGGMDGNLKEEIRYEGEEEFERVCRTFNAMQHTILEDQRQRERNEKARTDMVTGISHDLRTPLTSIRGYIKGVLDGVADTDEKRKLYLQTAYESTEDMNILLQKLFDFSRMESGQMPFHMVKVDLAEFTSAWIAQKESTLNSLQVRLSFLQEGA